MRTNVHTPTTHITHEGAPAKRITPYQRLQRSVMSCLLWETQFYEDGQSIADRIAALIPQCTLDEVLKTASDARNKQYLRHVPLLLLYHATKHPSLTHETSGLIRGALDACIHRPDELGEFISIWLKYGSKKGLTRQVKLGLSDAIRKFNAYQLAKWDLNNASVKLRDVLRLCHAKPASPEQGALWKQVLTETLPTPETWETELSAGKDKKETWERLLTERKLGGLALLRNLRNMEQAGVGLPLIRSAITAHRFDRVLPFRFIAAARFAPQLEPDLEAAMLRRLGDERKLPGRTVVLVDVSGSMDTRLSAKSDMSRMDAACGVAMIARELCSDVLIATFSHQMVICPPRRGFALRDAIVQSQNHGATYLGAAINTVHGARRGSAYDRIIVVTDEQSHDAVPGPRGKGYMINVASAKNGVGYGKWTHIDGWSESVVRYICEIGQSNGI